MTAVDNHLRRSKLHLYERARRLHRGDARELCDDERAGGGSYKRNRDACIGYLDCSALPNCAIEVAVGFAPPEGGRAVGLAKSETVETGFCSVHQSSLTLAPLGMTRTWIPSKSPGP